MSAKHTAGPWTVVSRSTDKVRGKLRMPAMSLVAAGGNQAIDCSYSGDTPAESDANASLIAAAPMLLAELRKARDRLASALRIGGSSPEYIAEALATHDAAIAAATEGDK